MSKQIDPTNLSDDDKEYIKQRPWIRDEMILQGYDDPLADDSPPDSPIVTVDSHSEPPSDLSPEESSSSDYAKWKNKELEAEIDSRNEGRDEDRLPKGKHDEMVATLEADDESDDEDDEDDDSDEE
jgi:hypothetical protein